MPSRQLRGGLPAHRTRRSNDVRFLRIRHPHVASPHEGSVVLGPVPDAILCLVLRMHSRLHIEIMTRRRSRWATCRPLLAHRAESAHQRPAVPPASAPLRRKRAVAHDVEAQFSTVVTPARGAGHPVDRVRRSRVPGGTPRFSPTISEVKATDQQRPAQAPTPRSCPLIAPNASIGIFGRGVSAPVRILTFTSKSCGVC